MWGWLAGCFDLARAVEWVWAGWGLALAEELGGRLVLWFPACVVGLGWLVVWCVV